MRLPLDGPVFTVALAAFSSFPGPVELESSQIAFTTGLNDFVVIQTGSQAVRRFFFPNQRRLPDYFGLRCIFSGFPLVSFYLR